MQVGGGHPQFRPDAVEEQLAVGAFERQRMRRGHFPAVDDPFIHAPEVRVLQRHVQRIDETRHERKLLGRADGSADAHGNVCRRLLPRGDVLERFGKVELLERVVEHDAEPGPGQLPHVFGREPGRIREEVMVERRVVPPSPERSS